ncbi:translation initiation factor IF-2-like protein [Labeo rohita]|uniref:Translation initiation factor IF-2-like protein n=1 Tax=Labeo rohita TaxID=84645 RepID=A0A498NME4_LABRO|nr:translation initiation factor IF-2-like protein [Labeo rohita]
MATLQVYQAKALKELHKGSPDQAVMQELRAVTDFALRATKVTARSLGQVMSTLVVQERHLWLNLAQMADADKARFLDAPVSQTGLFGDTVEDFAQQFLAVQKQTEAIKHILPFRETTRKSPDEEKASLVLGVISRDRRAEQTGFDTLDIDDNVNITDLCPVTEEDGIKGVVIGILVVVENVMKPLPAFYNDIALVIEKEVVMRHLSDYT